MLMDTKVHAVSERFVIRECDMEFQKRRLAQY